MPANEIIGRSVQQLELTPEQIREIGDFDYTAVPGFSEETHKVEIPEETKRWGIDTDRDFEARFKRFPRWMVIGDRMMIFGKINPPKPGVDVPEISTEQDLVVNGMIAVQQITADELSKEPISDHVAEVLQIFKRVEDNLPDFSRHAASAFRNVMGIHRSYFQWNREELNHSDFAKLSLLATGKRTQQELDDDFYRTQERTFELPFDSDIKMILYAMYQERNTHGNYDALEQIVRAEGAIKIALGISLTKSDEQVHGISYHQMAERYAAISPEKRVEAAKAALEVAFHFRMPSLHLMRDRLNDTIKVVETIGYNEEGIKNMLRKCLTSLSFVPEHLIEPLVQSYWPAEQKRIRAIGRQYARDHKEERDVARKQRGLAKGETGTNDSNGNGHGLILPEGSSGDHQGLVLPSSGDIFPES